MNPLARPESVKQAQREAWDGSERRALERRHIGERRRTAASAAPDGTQSNEIDDVLIAADQLVQDGVLGLINPYLESSFVDTRQDFPGPRSEPEALTVDELDSLGFGAMGTAVRPPLCPEKDGPA